MKVAPAATCPVFDPLTQWCRQKRSYSSGLALRSEALQARCRWFETGIGDHHNAFDVLQAAVLDARERSQHSIMPPALKALPGEPVGFNGITGALARAAGEEARDRTWTVNGSFSLWLRPGSRSSSWARPAC